MTSSDLRLPLASPRAPRRGRLSRALVGLWSLLYLLLAAGVPVVDGFADHDAEVVAHIEDADGGDCPASHGTEGCELCHLVQGARALPTAAPSLSWAADAKSSGPVPGRVHAPAAFAFFDGHSSRAPPALG